MCLRIFAADFLVVGMKIGIGIGIGIGMNCGVGAAYMANGVGM